VAAPHRSGPRSAFRRFLQSESAGGLVLMAASAAALVIANSPLAGAYEDVLHFKIGGVILLHAVNDGLMAVFFLLVGLEIKRELIAGELASWQKRILPGVAALGGMIVPALIFVAINAGPSGAIRGWAVPAATDIAFSLAILGLLGSRAPVSLKIFLTALAILDDLGAVAIIALFYAHDLAPLMLLLAALTFVGLLALGYFGVNQLGPYLVLGVLLWFLVLNSGVHATVAGALLAATIPLGAGGTVKNTAPLVRLENCLHPWVTFAVLPIFGFANAGVSILGV
jgi:NhaA family Na+:H+ antiporter